MFYPHTIKGKPNPRLDLISAPVIPNIPGPNFTINTSLTGVGTTNPDQFEIPLIPSLGYTASIDWGDGEETIITSGSDSAIHTYASPGLYDITITGIFPSMAFNGGGDAIKMVDWMVWNDIGLTEGSFDGCSNLTFSSTDTFNVVGTSLQRSFKDCQLVTSVFGLETLSVSSITDMSSMFDGASLFNQDIGTWSVSNVTTFNGMFRDCSAFNQDIGTWGVSVSATDLSSMFSGASIFSQDLNTWDVSNVERTAFMFSNATAFNGDITGWDTGNIIDLAGMFLGASTFNQDIGGWDVSSVISCGGLFLNATSFNQDLNTWDTSNFATLEFMFMNATSYNQPVSNWVTDNVLEMQFTFSGATSFNQDLSTWNTALVEDMESMFNGAISFNQDISSFIIANVTKMGSMLDSCAMNTTNYDAWLNSCAAQSPSIQDDVVMGAAGRTFSVAATGARSFLPAIHNWTIIGDSPV